MFDFNASLNDVAPVSPMLLSVDVKRNEKSELFLDDICVFFLLYVLHRLSFVSVVFDFSASINDVAPVSHMSLSVDENEKKRKERIASRCLLCLSFVFTTQIEFGECCV